VPDHYDFRRRAHAADHADALAFAQQQRLVHHDERVVYDDERVEHHHERVEHHNEWVINHHRR
jgi:hypothetical protein